MERQASIGSPLAQAGRLHQEHARLVCHPGAEDQEQGPQDDATLFEAERHGEDADPHDAVYDVRDQPPFGGGSCGHFEGLGTGTANATLANHTPAALGSWTGVAEINLQTLPGYAAA